MNKITLYLDMDGVLANFDKKFQELKTLYEHDEEDHVRFRDAVMKYKIFEDLEYMPDTNVLLNHVSLCLIICKGLSLKHLKNILIRLDFLDL